MSQRSSLLAGLWSQHALDGGDYGCSVHCRLEKDVALIFATLTHHKRKVVSVWGEEIIKL